MAKRESKFKTIEEMHSEKYDWVEQTKRLNNFEGIKNTLTKLYTSSGHFIFELLQNAEDVFATAVTFKLELDRLIFEHNGSRPFDINDIDSITNIGDSTKEDNGNTIGKFGIGFKSVFEYTNSPEIHSGEFHFAIEDLFVPSVIDKSEENDYGRTAIIIPFNNPSKSVEKSHEEIKCSLNELQPKDLLFLKNISEINYIIGTRTTIIKRIDSYSDDNCPRNACRLSKKTKEGNVVIIEKSPVKTQQIYKRFFKSIDILGEDGKNKDLTIGIAFNIEYLKEDKKWKIKPLLKENTNIPNGEIFAYFPCKAEEKRFCFHIHAPFALTVDREKLREDAANKSVMEEIGSLLCESIEELKNDGLVDLELYKALPNQKDDENLGNFEIVRAKIINYFLDNPYILMTDGTYQNGRNKYIGFHNIQQLLSNEDLSLLYDTKQGSFWVKNPMQNRRDYNFLTSLQIEEYTIVDFLNAMLKLKSESTERYLNIIKTFETRSSDWYVRLYSLMNASWNSKYSYRFNHYREDEPVLQLQLCHCNDDKNYKFDECYLTDTVSDFESSTVHFVNQKILNSKKTESDLYSFFKNKLGIKEYKITDMIQNLCEEFEQKEEKSISDSIEFYKMYQKEPSIIEILRQHEILCSDDGIWDTPDWFYLPEEFGNSIPNISIYYDFYNSKVNTENSKISSTGYYYSSRRKEHYFYKLSAEYKSFFRAEQELSDFIDFLKELNIQTSLCVWKSSCKTNPIWKNEIKENAPFTNGVGNPTDEDYEIKYLNDFLKRPEIEGVFDVIFGFLQNAASSWKNCRYSPAQKYHPKIYSSHIVIDLTNSAWVLQEDDRFVKPEEAFISKFPTKYKKQIENSNLRNWLSAINFGKKEREQNEQQQKENEILSSIGLDIGFVDIIRDLKSRGVSDLDLNAYMQALKDDLQSKISDGFFSNEILDEERIKNKTADKYKNADNITSEKKMRSVRIVNKQKELAESFLRNVCIDKDNKMHCQICNNYMPFKNKDGKDYFETVQLFPADFIKKDMLENYVALCPICSAKMKVFFQHDKTNKKKLYDRIRYSQPNAKTFKIDLDKEENILFSDRHIIALKKIIDEAEKNKALEITSASNKTFEPESSRNVDKNN